MKKISLIAGLAMLVTVGGVFAAWEFGNKSSVDSETSVTIGIEHEVEDFSATSISLNADAALGFDIAQTEAGSSSYAIEARGTNKSLTATYTNNSGIDLYIKVDVDFIVDCGTDGTDERFNTKEKVRAILDTYLDVTETAMEAKFAVSGTTNAANNGAENQTYDVITSAKVLEVLNTWKLNTVTDASKARDFIKAIELTSFTFDITVSLVEA